METACSQLRKLSKMELRKGVCSLIASAFKRSAIYIPLIKAANYDELQFTPGLNCHC